MSKYFYWNGLKIVANMIKNGVITENKLATAVQTKLNAKELPTVTSADEGKVATVDNNGDWVAETPSGGNNDFVVTYTVDTGSGEPVFSADKTFAEITSAIESGKRVIAKLEHAFLVLTFASSSNIDFMSIIFDKTLFLIEHNSDNTISGDQSTITIS